MWRRYLVALLLALAFCGAGRWATAAAADEAADAHETGWRLYGEGRYEEALPYLDRAIELYRRRGDQAGLTVACCERGNAFNALGRPERAIQDYDEVIRLDPRNTVVYNNRGGAYESLKQYELAFEDYSEAIRLNPREAVIFNNRGQVQIELGRYEAAIPDYDEAIRLNPRYAQAYHNRGNAYWKLHQYERALEDFNEGQRLNELEANAADYGTDPVGGPGVDRVTIDFESETGEAAAYLAGFGVTLAGGGAIESSRVFIEVTASSGSHFFRGGSGEEPVTFTLTFDRPCQAVSFTRVALTSRRDGISRPEWSVEARDEKGRVLEQVSEGGVLNRASNQTFTISRPGIKTVEFSAARGAFADFVPFRLDDLVLDRLAAPPATVPVWTNSLGMKFIAVPAGEFLMGSPDHEVGRSDDEMQHRVRLTRDFHLGQYEVTQRDWQAVMGDTPAYFRGDNLPVERVSWDDATEFCRKLGELTGESYRLPTEAEWEYACRAGSTTAYCFGDDPGGLTAYAWYDGHGGHPVGEKRPNGWGFYDMHGNVAEWCSDGAGDYPPGTVNDPTGPDAGADRVSRGGAWYSLPASVRSAFRYGVSPSARYGFLGFRVVRARP